MIRITIFICCFLVSASSIGQSTKRPKNIEEVIEIIKTYVNDSVIKRSQDLSQPEFTKLCGDWNSEYHKIISDWLYENEEQSKIEKYYSKLGIKYIGNIEEIISVALYRSFHNEPVKHNELIEKYATIELKWAEEDKVRETVDSLRGIYIPKDLNDCFKQIGIFWSDSTKNKVKTWTEVEFSGKCHFGLWMRNNWQLWGGSRLSKYFNDMGVYHPDDMSGMILTSYHRYLSGSEIKMEDQIKSSQNYWEKVKDDNKEK